MADVVDGGDERQGSGGTWLCVGQEEVGVGVDREEARGQGRGGAEDPCTSAAEFLIN
jgi:hypothetical protein